MIDPSYSRQRDQEDRAAVWARQRRMIIALFAAFILLGGGLSIVWGFSGVSSPAREQVPNELLETAKGLGLTQQQAVDQLQVVQDQLVAQQTETKKLSEQLRCLLKSWTPSSNRLPISRRRPLPRPFQRRRRRPPRNSSRKGVRLTWRLDMAPASL